MLATPTRPPEGMLETVSLRLVVNAVVLTGSAVSGTAAPSAPEEVTRYQ
jgi:hypothetical protein